MIQKLRLGILSFVLLAGALAAQLPDGVTREQMWPAPTAEDWKKPCLVTWQRTWEDAVAFAKQTQRPLLVCANMDGEIASEHYAGIRYRQPEIAKLYEPYVCVIASVYRHTPRDYDDQGRRIPCPRFGTVTCAEHIVIEPVLYEKFFDGQRIAPRHICVELDGKETYDVFYAWDTDSVFAAIKKGITDRAEPPKPIVRGDRSILERVASPDSVDRGAVEDAYAQGDAGQRKSLLDAALATGDAAPVDLLRLAVFGLDTDLSRKAREALARSKTESATELISEALRVPMDAPEKDALLTALARLGESSPRARTLSVMHQGLATRSTAVDVDRWALALQYAESARRAPSARSALAPEAAREFAAADEPEVDPAVTAARIADRAAIAGSGDASRVLELAEAFLASALDPSTADDAAKQRFREAQETALKAEALGAPAFRTNATAAVAAYYLGNMDEARQRAEAAVAGLPPEPQSWNSMIVLGLFAEARREAIMKAVREKKEWPGKWISDVHAAYAVLGRHVHGTDSQAVAHHDFLRYLGATAQASRVLDEGLVRFPDSPLLHNRLRSRILEEKGVDGLEPAYAKMIEAGPASPGLQWFAGYASVLAAENWRRSGRTADALAAYGRAVARFERHLDLHPDQDETAEQMLALCLAGRARLAYEKKDFEHALAELLAAIERKPAAFATPDGLNITPADTARMLKARFTEAKREDLLAKLDAALAKLDPELLKLPAYERGGPPPPGNAGEGQRPPGRRRRGQGG